MYVLLIIALILAFYTTGFQSYTIYVALNDLEDNLDKSLEREERKINRKR